MSKALEEIDRKPELYISQIPEITKSLRKDWLLKNNLMSQASVSSSYMNLQQKFAVVCKSCGAFLCYSDRIVLCNNSQHVCVDPDYLDQVTLYSLSDREVSSNRASLRHYCVEKLTSGVCGADLGSLASHKTGISLPILSCRGIVFIRVPQNHTSKIIDDTAEYSRYSFKTWKDARKIFEPKPLSIADCLQ
uniref:RLR CTR domain-containing protein n=1 Tax=Ditylenchus dipsaci TaxID=166011 RepID=A0A915E462_9BILA